MTGPVPARLSRTLARTAELVLLAVTAWLLARLTWLLVLPPAPPPVAAADAAPTTARSGDPLALARRIAAAHLMGEAPPAAAPAGPAQAPPPATALRLTLRGVLASGDPAAARAIIADASGEEAPYAPGARLPGDAVLEAVGPDHVLLRRGGRLERLVLAEPEAGAADAAPPPAAAAAAPAGRRSLREYRDALLTDPQSVADAVRVEPVSRDGAFLGFRLRPGRDRTLLARLGLRSSDIITEVNGVRLDSPVRALEVLGTLEGTDTVEVTVLRRGRPERLTVRLDAE
ncbi:type II secretion system protein GspC [Inmirania thermothiophila]|uniref:Type II secretion system protein C (GspC) n=1 Tax=Inmirania thermothiophila TaxID=1750597 RepID=A0A3N1XTK4_9GAMM|nr:type II secretion system protein GspC [Inmirania thermothiophila]ROR29578.1 type II secretion system protein C (GspC) [Inmirania thermothiophila]